MADFGNSVIQKCSLVAAVVMVGVLTCSVSAQSSVDVWARVERIAVSTPLIIQTAKGKHLFGHFKSAYDSKIVLQQEKGDVSIDRQSVKKVYVAIHKKKNGAKLLSMLTFLGVGMLLNIADERISPDWPTLIPLFGAGTAAALVQAELTKGFKKGALIYRIK